MALLPPFFLDTVVAIGVGDESTKRTWIGTGFIYGDLLETEETSKQGQNLYRLWLITNKHVLLGRKHVFIKFNSAQEPNSQDYKVALTARNGRPSWVGHPNETTDVAAIFVSAQVLKKDRRNFAWFRSDINTMAKGQMKAAGITEGDHVFVLGFPMGLVSAERQYVICRGGYIARLRDFLENKSKDYLIDCMVFPGNSGGPVVTCPSATAIEGTKALRKADLIGIVKTYVAYRDFAVSKQTGMERILFEENSGLTVVESIDAIRETVELATKRTKRRLAQRKYRVNKQLQPLSHSAIPQATSNN